MVSQDDFDTNATQKYRFGKRKNACFVNKGAQNKLTGRVCSTDADQFVGLHWGVSKRQFNF
jgi:hypothetical protein